MKLIKSTRFLAIIGIICAFISAILLYANNSYTDAIGIISTIISIILGFVSIVYTYTSGESTIKALDEIRIENRRLVDKINYELCKDNYNEVNIESLSKK